jgi:hypothetical protein
MDSARSHADRRSGRELLWALGLVALGVAGEGLFRRALHLPGHRAFPEAGVLVICALSVRNASLRLGVAAGNGVVGGVAGLGLPAGVSWILGAVLLEGLLRLSARRWLVCVLGGLGVGAMRGLAEGVAQPGGARYGLAARVLLHGLGGLAGGCAALALASLQAKWAGLRETGRR